MEKSAAQKLKEFMTPGRVYRRAELEGLSSNLTRDLDKLVKSKELVRAAPGLYYHPEKSRFGPLGAKPEELVRAFLKTDDFLITALDVFNGLGVGLTQLVNETLVYNRKRAGRFVLDGKRYQFKKPLNFPRRKEANKTYLFVDLLNNYNELLERPDNMWSILKRSVKEYNKEDLFQMAELYGRESAKKMLKELMVNG